jgi:CubicO group peptidase (beta-lactamase class C family)
MFLTAGYLVEQITGKSWEDNVRERIFEPLGMASSNFSVHDSQKTADYAVPHHEVGDTTQVIPFRDIDVIGPAGSINSSINDMTRWLLVQTGGGEIDGNRFIEEATLRSMHTPHTIIGGYPTPDATSILQVYGLGWFIESFRGEYFIHHGGGIDGFITMVAFLPQKGIGVVTLSNATTSGLSPILNSLVVDRLLGHTDKDWLGEALEQMKMAEESQEQAEKDRETTRVAGTSPSHPLEDYVGEYEHPGYGVLTISMADGTLNAEFNRMTNVLEHWHYDVFEAPAADDNPLGLSGKFQFRSDLDGNVVAVVSPMEPMVGDIVFERLPDKRLSDPEYLTRFTGVYELMGQKITVLVRGTSLFTEVTGQPSQKLIPVSGTTFTLKGMEGISVTFVEENDAVTAIRFNQPSGVYTAKKVE